MGNARGWRLIKEKKSLLSLDWLVQVLHVLNSLKCKVWKHELIRPVWSVELRPSGWIRSSLLLDRACFQPRETRSDSTGSMVESVTRRPRPGHLSFFFFLYGVQNDIVLISRFLILESFSLCCRLTASLAITASLMASSSIF